MGFRVTLNFFLFVLFASLCLNARAESSGSVVFLEGSSGKYLRNQPLDSDGERTPISVSEVTGVASVLLGFAPDSSLAIESSSKLNNILTPNPFERPHAVFLLEVSGLDDVDYSKLQVQTVIKDKLVGSKGLMHLPGEEVLVTKIEESLDGECNSACLDKEFTYLSNFLEGSYSGSVATEDGKLALPLASGGALYLHVAKEAELHFASSLAALVRGINMGVEFHGDLAGTGFNPAELITGRFTGFKALIEEHGNSEILQQGVEIFQTTISKLFEILNRSYEGKIVGVLIYNKESGMVEVASSARISRWLEETSISTDNSTTASEVKLVRRSLAWITGIILLISTLIGVCMLMNMPLTRDTLLYSNVKLD
ncbi:Type 1 membrane protein-like [Rhynchospora pubera]|uniref:Type 1 membrane protein-like n=1 Tax=Rhynchospora pubera TaxID=906938 RepID=A0AAV8F2Z5_9POAL|nr:Type 1 membrane protein-like [Rhynchospora pubera]